MRRLAIKTKVVRKVLGAVAAGAATEAAQGNKGVLQLIRYDPDTNSERIESYEYVMNTQYMVLDLLQAVKAFHDPSLAFRASCCEGVCGSCAMNINGTNSLACITFAKPRTIIGPLPNFPVIKDTVVDLRGFFRQYEFIRPYIRNEHLPRYHIDNVYDRYLKVCKTLYGSLVDPTSSAGAPGPAGTVRPDMGPFAAVLDKCVALGDAASAIEVLRKMKTAGIIVPTETARDIVKQALANF